MTPTLPRVLTGAALLVASTTLATTWIDVRFLQAAATAVAVVALGGLIAHYARTSAWWSQRIGRTSMGLYASVLTLAVGAGFRRISEVSEALGSGPIQWARDAGDQCIASGWLLVAVSAVAHLVAVIHLQATVKRHPDDSPLGGGCPRRRHLGT